MDLEIDNNKPSYFIGGSKRLHITTHNGDKVVAQVVYK